MPLADIFAAIRWWVVLMLLGAAATPLAYRVFHRLPDRGYAFVKMLGLLVVSYLFWLLGSLGFLDNSIGGILFALVGLVALSAWVYRRNTTDLPLRQWLRQQRTQVIATELVFAAAFALWVWVRAQNPAIEATEKPMEFAFLNAVGRSPTFPPLDPWLSGFAISYYYFGYVMTSVIARLAAVPEPVAFNLGIAWLLAGTAVGAFGLVYNLVATGGARRSALVLGLVAALALPIAGNLQIVLEVLHANNAGSAAFWQWLDVRDINEPPQPEAQPRYHSTAWWWWRSSRVIHEYHLSGRAEEGLEPIAEFPAFSFILGDMHPHVLALPFAFLSLAAAFTWWLEASRTRTDQWPSFLNNPQSAIRNLQSLVPNLSLWAVTVLVLGGLSFLNTWDVLIHLFVVVAAFTLAQWRAHGRMHSRLLAQALTLAVLLALPAFLLYLPFYLGFRSQAGPPFLLPMLMRPTRLAHFLIIFGMPFWSITILLVALAARQRLRHWQTGVAVAAGVVITLLLLMLFLGWIIASSSDGAGRVLNLAGELGLALPPRPDGTALGWGLAAVFTLLPSIISARLALPGLTLLLGALLALVIMLWLEHFQPDHQANTASPPPPALPFVLLLIATGALLTLGPEFVYLRDNFGQRLNTIFKFYYQAWVMFGVAAIFALDYLWREARKGRGALAAVATAGYSVALALALLFPYYAVASRAAAFRGPVMTDMRQPATLDGLANLRRYNPDDYDAIMWLRHNVDGMPVVLEALGGQYSPQGHGRVSANTGLPTILQWAGHQYQWRGFTNPEPSTREPVVQTIYQELNWDSTAALLDRYQVEYIYVGRLELDTYGPQGLEKFNNRLEIAYRNNSVIIYRWRPGGEEMRG